MKGLIRRISPAICVCLVFGLIALPYRHAQLAPQLPDDG